MLSPLMTAWITLAVFCLVGVFFPSIRNANWRVSLGDKLRCVFFPLRTLAEKKLVCKNDLMKHYTDICVDGKINLFAVVWYVFAFVAVLFLLIAGPMLDKAGLSVFITVVAYFFSFIVVMLAIGIFTGDKKYRSRVPAAKADAAVFHEHERAIAQCVGEQIAEDQAKMQPFGYHWHIDILCTDRLSDEPIRSAIGTLSSFTGVPQTNPVYMSRVAVALLNDDDEPVPFPAKRRSDFDIAFTQSSNVIVFSQDYIIGQVVTLIHDVTAMVLHRAKK